MSNLYVLEARARQAMLDGLVETYKQRRTGWRNEPAIKKLMFIDAFLSWPSLIWMATILLVAIICTPFLQSTYTLTVVVTGAVILLGLIIEILILDIGSRNEVCQSRAIAKQLQPTVAFSLDTIHDRRLKVKLFKALQYWSFINDLIQSKPQGYLNHLATTRRDITHWLQAIYMLAHRIDQIYLNPIIRQDLEKIPLVIQQCRQAMQRETAPQARKQLEQTLAYHDQLLQTLQVLKDQVRRAHQQIDHTTAALGVISAQLLLITDKNKEGNKLSRLQADITEEVACLKDLLETMDEIYQYN